jgi:hypothetical protein
VIVEFKPVDLNTFESRFNGHVLQIIKQSSGDWKLYVDYLSGKNLVKTTPRACMEMAEKAATEVLKKLTKRMN